MWMNPMSPAVPALSIDPADVDPASARPPTAVARGDAGAVQQATITFASPAAGVADGDDSTAAATPR